MEKLIAATLIASSIVNAGDIGVGIASDMGFGVTAQYKGMINAQLGHAGIAIDYLFLPDNKIKINKDLPGSLSWYVGAGAGFFFGEWTGHNGDIDFRLPVGLDWDFHKQWDAYLQVIPALRVDDNIGFGIGAALGVRYYL